MSILIKNDNNITILDDFFPQAKLIYSGTMTTTATTLAAQTTFTYPAPVSNPIIFIRQQNLNQKFSLIVSKPDSFVYSVNSAGSIDYRIYAANKTIFSNNQYGLRVFDAQSNPIFDSGFAPPDIRQRSVIATTTTLTANTNVPFTALDGGRPFVIAHAFAPFSIAQNSGQTSLYNLLCCSWTSATNLLATVDATQQLPVVINASLGMRPRLAYFSR